VLSDQWEPLDEGQGSRDSAELLGIDLGPTRHQRPAQISTDAFALAVWYDYYEVHMNDNIPQKVIDAVRAAWHIEGDLKGHIRIQELTHDWVAYQTDLPESYIKQTASDSREQTILEPPSQYPEELDVLRSMPFGGLCLVVPKNGKNWFLVTSGGAADEESGVSWEYDVTVESCPHPSQEAAAILSKHLYRPNPDSIRALDNDDLEAFLSLEQIVHPPIEYAIRALQNAPFHLGIYTIDEPILLIKALKSYGIQLSLVRPNDSGGYHSDNVS
jgi:hypothetical protein